ncbi:MAG TPA: phosphotransferase [Thermoanaerobaculia bacterium]|nr:phosphotransferase [Thermoanaerobaculia bacterium]
MRNAVAVLCEGAPPLEEQSQPLLFLNLRPNGPVARRASMTDRVIDVPRFSQAVLVANALRFFRGPAGYAAALLRTALTPFALPLFPAGVYIADLLQKRGIRHVHATGGTSRAARIAARVGGLSMSNGNSTRFPDFATKIDAADAILALDWRSVGAKPIGTRWITVRPDSTVAEVALEDGRSVIYKDIGPERDGSRTASERARHEYDTFNRLHDAMRATEAKYSVPRALLLDEPRGLVLLETAAGKSLDEIIGNAGKHTRTSDLAPAVKRAGEWLRAMQDATRSDEDGRTILANVVDAAHKDLERVAGIDKTIAAQRERIAARLRELARKAAAKPLRVAGHHGDYWPGNIFLSDTRVVVIDFEGFQTSLPLLDAAYFLVMLELLCRRFRQKTSDLRDAFFDGYGERPDDDMLALLTLVKTLQMLGSTGAHRPFLLRRFITNTLRGKILGALR